MMQPIDPTDTDPPVTPPWPHQPAYRYATILTVQFENPPGERHLQSVLSEVASHWEVGFSTGYLWITRDPKTQEHQIHTAADEVTPDFDSPDYVPEPGLVWYTEWWAALDALTTEVLPTTGKVAVTP